MCAQPKHWRARFGYLFFKAVLQPSLRNEVLLYVCVCVCKRTLFLPCSTAIKYLFF